MIILFIIAFALLAICWVVSRANDHARQQRITNYRLKMIAEGKPIETGWKGGLLYKFLKSDTPSQSEGKPSARKPLESSRYRGEDEQL